MNVFKRMKDIISSNINSALDRMEDPEKMIDLSIRQLEDAVAEMKGMLTDKSAGKSILEKKCSELDEEIKRWAERARLAAKKNLDEMAKEALLNKRELTERLTMAKNNVAELEKMILSLSENLAEAKKKLSELKETSITLKNRARIAKERVKVSRKANVSETSDYSRRLEELKAKIERWEREADMNYSDIRKEKGVTFSDLERDEEIERELEELKKGDV